jgi:hypothetical protein
VEVIALLKLLFSKNPLFKFDNLREVIIIHPITLSRFDCISFSMKWWVRGKGINKDKSWWMGKVVERVESAACKGF